MKKNLEGTQVEEIAELLLDQIKKEIERTKITQNEVAESCGLSKQALSNILNGHGSVSISNLIRILNGLGHEINISISKAE